MPAPADVTIRPMLPEDVPAGTRAARIALEEMYPEEVTPEERVVLTASQEARALHLVETDPGGCFVAEVDGQVVGTALSLIREGVWGFSLFGLLPAFQGLGIGTKLYAPALAYGEDAAAGLIMSSSHPAAMRRYARSAGFRMQPTVEFSGAWRPDALPAELRCRPGDLDADLDTIDAASRHVRGASHALDLPTALARPSTTLLVIAGEGFAVARKGSPALIAAADEAAAADLLWGCFASGTRGATVGVDCVTGENQWLIRACLDAGLAIAPGGGFFVRGNPGPLAPYLPSGAYL